VPSGGEEVTGHEPALLPTAPELAVSDLPKAGLISFPPVSVALKPL